MSREGFLSGSFQGSEAIFQDWQKGFSEWRIGVRFISKEEGERRSLR